MHQEINHPRRNVERRAVGRTMINRDVLMFFNSRDRACRCCVRRNESRRVHSAERSEYCAF
jgi:hypothetical protein